MQPLRTSVGQVSRQLNRNMNTLFPQSFSHNTGAMSLFPGFGQEFGPLFRLFDQHSRQAFPGIDRQLTSHMRSSSPRFDLKETTEGYELQGELPGVEQKDINIEWTDDTTLTISGRHEHVREEGQRPQAAIEEGGNKDQATDKIASTEPNTATTEAETQAESANAEKPQQLQQSQQETAAAPQDKYWVNERSVGEFQRSFSFPTRVDQDAVTASLKNGILSIVVPRGAAPPSKKIAIQ